MANHWTPVSAPYEENMPLTCVVQINGVEQQGTTLELGAFCDGECRGSQMAVYFEPEQRYIYQMIVFGEEGDMLTFRLYDHATQQELDLVAPEAIVFDAFGYGTLSNPIVLNFRQNYDIVVTVNPEVGGTVMGAGTYLHGETATLTATANEGYAFINWTLDGEEVSTEAEYSFVVTEAADYVANFELTAITQTVTLSAGWNWWSGYIELDGANSLQDLEEALGTNGLMIKSQNNGYASYLAGYGWYGSLSGVNNESMYQVRVGISCTLELTGLAVHPADHPITLVTGWNWIGYPVTTSMSIEEALSGITPHTGDMLKSQNSGYASYLEGFGWYGSLNTLEPGMGLMYKSNNSQPVTFTFPTENE